MSTEAETSFWNGIWSWVKSINTQKVKQIEIVKSHETVYLDDLIHNYICCSVTQSCPTFCNPMDCSTPGLPVHHISWSLLKLMSIESVMPSNHLILCHPVLLCLQLFPASGYFQMSHLFASGGQSTGASASASVLPMNIQGWVPLELTGLIFMQSKGC